MLRFCKVEMCTNQLIAWRGSLQGILRGLRGRNRGGGECAPESSLLALSHVTASCSFVVFFRRYHTLMTPHCDQDLVVWPTRRFYSSHLNPWKLQSFLRKLRDKNETNKAQANAGSLPCCSGLFFCSIPFYISLSQNVYFPALCCFYADTLQQKLTEATKTEPHCTTAIPGSESKAMEVWVIVSHNIKYKSV